jgi:predicted nucleic acid-binding protein
MCIIVDTNTFAKVFDPKNAEHQVFKPVFDWIIRGKSKLILGGTEYEQKELREKMPKYLNLLANLARAGKIHRVSSDQVDAETKRLEAHKNKDFDDPHIVALCIVSKTKLLCSQDKRSHKFVKNRSFYPKGQKPPNIYSQETHQTLLTNDALKPCC